MKTLQFMSVCLFLAFVASSARAGNIGITDLWNTGLNGSGQLLPLGHEDPHYRVSFLNQAGQPTYAAFSAVNPNWAPNQLFSQWISASAGGQAISGIYAFETRFDIGSAINPNLVEITGQWAADNQGYISINDVVTNNVIFGPNGYQSLVDFQVSGPGLFQVGTNTLRFVVTNPPGEAPNFTGVHVANITGSVVPEPGSLTLVVLGAMSAAAVAWHHRRKRT